jgi:hypothetical protein
MALQCFRRCQKARGDLRRQHCQQTKDKNVEFIHRQFAPLLGGNVLPLDVPPRVG